MGPVWISALHFHSYMVPHHKGVGSRSKGERRERKQRSLQRDEQVCVTPLRWALPTAAWESLWIQLGIPADPDVPRFLDPQDFPL